MQLEEAHALAAILREQMLWLPGLYVQRSLAPHQLTSGDEYSIAIVAGTIRLLVWTQAQWADVLADIRPMAIGQQIPQISREQFTSWARAQMARSDLQPWERPFPADLDLYVADPDNNVTRVAIASKTTVGTVVDGVRVDAPVEPPAGAEIRLTVAWSGPVRAQPR